MTAPALVALYHNGGTWTDEYGTVGTWLRDLQASNSAEHSYYGIDLVAELFPPNLPEGLTLKQQSFLDPWPSDWYGAFDLVHERFGLAGAGTSPIKDVLREFAALLKTGGYLEVVEMDTDPVDGNGPAGNEFLQLMKEIFALGGMGANFSRNLKGWLGDIGMDNVEERAVRLQMGVRATHPDLVPKSISGVCGSVTPLVAVANSKEYFQT